MRRLIALLLGLVALGSAAPAAAQQATPVRVGVIPIIGAAQVFVVDGEGWAKQAGLNLTFTTFESGPNMIQALASGTVDVYVGGVAPLAVARSRGIDVKVVTATAVEELVTVAGPKLAPYFAEGVTPAQAFQRFREREGRPARLATQPPGSVPNTALQHWLWEVTKTAKADVAIVAMGIEATQQAVLAEAVDGGDVREPALTIIQGRDPRIKLVATGGQMFPGQPGTVVAVSGAFLARNPEAVQTLTTLVVRATELLKTDPDRAAPHVEAALGRGIVDRATIRRALTSPASRFVADPGAIAEATEKFLAYQVTLGTLDKAAPIDGLFDRRFYERAAAAR